MKTFDYVIKDELGIHARPAGLLVKTAANFVSDITITKNGKQASAKKLFAIMGLCVKCNDTITISISGADEDNADVEIKNFFNNNL